MHTHLWPALFLLVMIAAETDWIFQREPAIWYALLGLPYHLRPTLSCRAFYLAVTCCLFLSSAFHLWAPISKKGYRMLLLGDQLGILGVISSSFLAGLHQGFCSQAVRDMYMWLYSGVTLGVLLYFSLSRCNSTRKLVLIAYCCSSMIPIIHLCLLEVGWLSIGI